MGRVPDEAARCGIDIVKTEAISLSNTMTVTEVDDDHLIISLKSTNASGELFVDKRFAANSDILSLLSKALAV